MIKNFTKFKIAKRRLLLNVILLIFSLCIVNISFAAEDFPWEIFYPAFIKKSIDKDKDGFTKEQGDCNDLDSSINPDATEICGDGIDQDCDGSDLPCPPCHDISGVWEFVFTNINSSCGPESDWSSTVTIVQNGCSLEATGFKNTSLEVTGSIENYTVTIGPGDFPEDDGITTSTFTLTLNTSETSMEGKESWTWNYLGSDACIDGTGDIIATKRF